MWAYGGVDGWYGWVDDDLDECWCVCGWMVV